MIKKCTDKESKKLLSYLYQNKEGNLFIIGDIYNFGFNTDFQHIFIDEIDNDINSVYLVYRDSLVISSYSENVDNAFIKKLIKQYDIKIVNGLKNIIDKVVIKYKKREDCFFAKMENINKMVDTDLVSYANYEQLPLIANTRKQVFESNRDELDSLQTNFIKKSGRTAAIFLDSLAVSMASSTAECDGLAMIVGVGTLPEYRNKGYASMCITKLSNDLLIEQKIPCLFYNNPSAGRIYKNLGYQDIGFWSMLRL